MIHVNKHLWYLSILFVFVCATVAESAIPRPARIFGEVTVDDILLTQSTDDGYALEVTRTDGSPYVPPAQLTTGLNFPSGYSINIPLYDAVDQPGGANPGDTAVIHVYRYGSELTVMSPANGEFTVGQSGSITQMDLMVFTPAGGSLQYSLTVSTTGSGSVTLNPSGGSYDEGTVVELTAVPVAGWIFDGWSGSLTGSANPATLTMNTDKSVTANFIEAPPVQYTLTASVVGGHGGISPTSGTYDEGSVVPLTATPDGGYRVAAWSGTDNDSSTSSTNTVTMNSNRSVSVQFEEIPPTQYQLTASVVGGHGGISPTSGTYNEGSVVPLTATPDGGYRVAAWSGTDNDSSTSSTNTVTMNSDRSVTVTFSEIPPVINSFAVTPSTISEGEFVTLSWNITGATSANIDNGVGAVVPVTGSVQAAPTSTTTYTLTASNAAGSVTHTVTVIVIQALPVINNFTATPSTINEGSSATLSWSITGADTATINNGVGNVSASSGSVQVSPTSTATYTLTASNAGGSVTRTVTVTVQPNPSLPVINSFVANPGTISEGGSVTLSWSITGADTATINNGVGGVSPSSSSILVSPVNTTTYLLTATNAAGSVTSTVIVTVNSQTLPVINSFSAIPDTINTDESASLYWDISGADSARINPGVGDVVPTSGSVDVSPTSTTTYTLTATNTEGSVTATATVTVPTLASPEIVETIPHDGAGIDDGIRVPSDTSFALHIVDADGIDITDPTSITFIIDDGVQTEYIRDLSDTSVVRVIKLTDDPDTQVTSLWVVYDRSQEDGFGNYGYGTQVDIMVDVKNSTGMEMTQASYSMGIETNEDHDAAETISPSVATVDPSDPDLYDPEYLYDAGIEITSGPLAGAKILYNSNEPVTPRFGPPEEVPSLDAHAKSDGMPLNLQPPNVFNTPVRVFIPYPDYSDVSHLCLYLFSGNRWVLACNAKGKVKSGGKGWMVPGSRVNHNNANPATVEIKVSHFSAVQAGEDNGGDGDGDDSCFILAARQGSLSDAPLGGLVLFFLSLVVGGLIHLQKRRRSLTLATEKVEMQRRR